MKALLLAFGQLDDPACFGVLLRSVGLALLAYVLLLLGSVAAIQALLAAVHWPGWLAAILGSAGVILLAIWLFLPTVMLIAWLYVSRIAQAVERRHYGWLPTPEPAAMAGQMYDGFALSVHVLLLNAVAVLIAFLVPGFGLVMALLVSGYAIGRGLFMAVAMRRMSRAQAHSLYVRQRAAVLLPGLVLAAMATLPGVNLLVPVVGAAAMVHVLNRKLADQT